MKSICTLVGLKWIPRFSLYNMDMPRITLGPARFFAFYVTFYRCRLSLYLTIMLASHCPEIYTRWTHEYENSYFARSWPRYKSKTSLQPKKLRFLQKVTRYTHECLAMASDTITRSHPSWYFPPRSLQAGHTKSMRLIHSVKMWIRCVRNWSRRRHVCSCFPNQFLGY